MDATYIDLTVRLSLALILGGAIGIEREYRAKEAGFRTHFLVALGSALFCVVSQYGFGFDLKDSSRVAAQVVSGIGFLGAGTIIFQKNVVRGLTTAAGLWVTAAIGLCSREVRHPPQVIQYDSIQIGFRDMVSRAGILASLAVGGAAEVVPFRLHLTRAAQHHVPAAVSAVD